MGDTEQLNAVLFVMKSEATRRGSSNEAMMPTWPTMI